MFFLTTTAIHFFTKKSKLKNDQQHVIPLVNFVRAANVFFNVLYTALFPRVQFLGGVERNHIYIAGKCVWPFAYNGSSVEMGTEANLEIRLS